MGKLRHNEGFSWDMQGGYQPAHRKFYLPDEADFWEASWYQRGEDDFTPLQLGSLRLGFQICTELWFMQRARAYGQQGVHLLLNPRAAGGATRQKWLVGGQAAAVISGAFCLSSNKATPSDSSLWLGGMGWIVSPDGDVLGLTSAEQPYVTVEIDPQEAERAKHTYPRYVRD